MGVLRGFERRLEGAVEGMFARAFRSGLQPIELAQATQRYCKDHKQVTSRGVVAPNQYRFILNPEDLDRMESHGSSLHRELGEVVSETCREHDWAMYGAPSFTFEGDDDIMLGRFEITGRIGTDTTGRHQPAPRDGQASQPRQSQPAEQAPAHAPQAPPAAASSEPAAPTPASEATASSGSATGEMAAAPGGSPGARQAPAGPAATPSDGSLFGGDPAGVTAPRPTGTPPSGPGSPPMPPNLPTGGPPDPQPTAALTPAAAAVPPPSAARPTQQVAPPIQLEVLDTGATLVVRSGRHTIGRSQDSDLSVDSTTVSRKHAVVLARGDTWWVFDLGSTNGTRVNGQRASELPIRPGDRVRVGTVELIVREA